MIDTIALLHQYQRPIRTTVHQGETLHYVEVTLADIAVANQLAHDVLGRTLDELAPQTRRLLDLIVAMVRERHAALEVDRCDVRFSRKDVREHAGWTDFQVKVHMRKLEALEYVLVHKGGRGQSFVYELLYNGEGQQGEAFVMGLLDIEQLKRLYDEKKEHPAEELERSGSAEGDGKERSRSTPENIETSGNPSAVSTAEPTSGETHYIDTPKPTESYRSGDAERGR